MLTEEALADLEALFEKHKLEHVVLMVLPTTTEAMQTCLQGVTVEELRLLAHELVSGLSDARHLH